MLKFLAIVKAFRENGVPDPRSLAFSCEIKARYWFHRTYLYSDRDGFVYDPMILQWNFGRKMIWRNDREIDRQKTAAAKEQSNG